MKGYPSPLHTNTPPHPNGGVFLCRVGATTSDVCASAHRGEIQRRGCADQHIISDVSGPFASAGDEELLTATATEGKMTHGPRIIAAASLILAVEMGSALSAPVEQTPETSAASVTTTALSDPHPSRPVWITGVMQNWLAGWI